MLKAFFTFIIVIIGVFLLQPVTAQPPASCTNQRYRTDIFTANTQTNVATYATATAVMYPPYISETSTYSQNLKFDLYTPDGDTCTKRPLVIVAFGGAFLVGTKSQIELVAFCKALARKGYVAAAIDYRLGYNILNESTAIRAVYRAGQDVRAAVRYFKEHASTYGIDTNYIFAGGNSAGAVASIHTAYLTDAERAASPLLIPTYTVDQPLLPDWPDLGCIDCSGNNYVHNGAPKAVVNLWGAIGDTLFMDAGEAAIVSFHGTNDNIVNIGAGVPFGATGFFPVLYGSQPISERAANIPLAFEFYPFEGQGHELWTNPTNADFINEKTALFLYHHLLKPTKPTLLGNATACNNGLETYSVTHHYGSVWCWQIVGGQIVGDATQNSIQVNWQTPGMGSITVREINSLVAESDTAYMSVNIVNPPVPINLTAANIGLGSADISWSEPYGFETEIRYRQINGNNTWATTSGGDSGFKILSGLSPCSQYEMQISSLCSETQSQYSTSVFFNTPCANLAVTCFLEGSFNNNTQTMNTTLRSKDLLPNTQPFNTAPWWYAGNQATPTLPSQVVDWVLIELRPQQNTTQIAERHAALLFADGSIRATNGNTFITLSANINPTLAYYVIVRHRNHLGVMSAQALPVSNTMTWNFSTQVQQAYGIGQQIYSASGIALLRAGDADASGNITVADFNVYNSMTALLNGYYKPDFNLDGNITVADFNLYHPNASSIGVWEVQNP